MTCQYFMDGVCVIASQLAGANVLPVVSQCEHCTNQAEPKQSINKVTVSLAIKGAVDPLTKAGIMRDYMGLLSKVPAAEPQGPGTELKKLISWFYSPDKKKCQCDTRIAKMNKWGPDKCEEKIETIVRWLKHSAKIHNVPFFKSAVVLLVKKAIKNARKK